MKKKKGFGTLERNPEWKEWWDSVDESAREAVVILNHHSYKKAFFAGLQYSDVFFTEEQKEKLWREYVDKLRKENLKNE